MARTDFLGAAYAARSLPLAGQTLINLLYEPAPPGSAYEGMFYNTPGLVLDATVGTGPVRGTHSAGGSKWVVSGASLYRDGVLIGTIPGSGRVCIVHDLTYLIVMHSAGWRAVTLSNNAIADVAGAPTTAQGTFHDSYIEFPLENGTFGWTDVGNAVSIDALSFASDEGQPDPTIAVKSTGGQVWNFGTETLEIRSTTSDPDAPFGRVAIVDYGTAAKYSPACTDNTVFFLGRNAKGQGCVYRAEGYTPARISTFALEDAIAGYTVEDAYGECFQLGGHSFYLLAFPEASWLYDISNGRWTQWAYRNPLTGDLERHRANTVTFHAGETYVGDHASGKVYRLDLDTYADNGDLIYWERAWAVIEAENKNVRHDRLELLAEMGVGLNSGQGSDPIVLLSWSDDGCRTWSNDRELHLGAIGRYRNRAIARRLGMSRNRVYRIRGTDPVKRALYGANLDANVGSR